MEVKCSFSHHVKTELSNNRFPYNFATIHLHHSHELNAFIVNSNFKGDTCRRHSLIVKSSHCDQSLSILSLFLLQEDVTH